MRERLILATVIGLILFGAGYGWSHRSPDLPYFDKFGDRNAEGWLVMGGNWQFDGTAVVNRSDEHGAKLVTGSGTWGDISLDADLKLIGHAGDVGVLVRVNHAEPGVDAYSGYYVGLRSNDRSLILGRADFGWMEGKPTAIAGGVIADRWYHLHVVAVGCMIAAEATDTVTGETTDGMLQERDRAASEGNPGGGDCLRQGMIGIRSMATGGAWKHIAVRRATAADIAPIRRHVSSVQEPRFIFHGADIDSVDLDSTADETAAAGVNPLTSSFTNIETIKMQGLDSQGVVSIRGFVTLLDPLYIQDTSGGVLIEAAHGAVLNLGDEVEITGTGRNQDDKVIFVARSLELTGDRTLIPPSSVTSTQAAGILFDGRLAELRARLLNKFIDSDGRVVLLLDDAAQTFRAEGPLGLSKEQFERLIPGSEVRVRGVCRVGPWEGRNGGAFTILMRSMEDVDITAGPPWWSPRFLIREIAALVLLIGLCIYIYLKVERSKMHAILEERARLAHEMHDTLAQNFAGVGFHLQGVRSSVRSGTLTTSDVIDRLTLACELITRTHRDASAEIAALSPGADDGSDLLTLLERCAYTMLEGNYVPIRSIREGTPRSLSLAVRDAVFRIGREAITNVLRHAQAETITLRIRYEYRTVTLEIIDDGCGFDHKTHADDFGLRGMRSRSAAIGATLEVISDLGYGTSIRIRTPYKKAKTFQWVRLTFSSLKGVK
jgi:signal transduction histidine kinase